MKLTTLATCNLTQWALDFEGNFGADYRVDSDS